MPIIRENYFQVDRLPVACVCLSSKSANCKPRLRSAGSCCAFPSEPGCVGGETKRLEFCLTSAPGEGSRCPLIIGAVHLWG